MPSYTIYNSKTKTSEDVLMSYSELEALLEANPHLSQQLSAPKIVSGVDGLRRIDSGFKDLLKRIKKNNRKSTINV